MNRIMLAAVAFTSLAGLAGAQVAGRPGVRTGQGTTPVTGDSPTMTGFNPANPWWRNTTFNNSQPGSSAWMNQLNQAQLNQLNQNPALLNQLNQNPALLNQLLQNPALFNQLLQNPALLNQLNGLNNGQALNSAGFPFFGGAFFPFSPYYNNASFGPGYTLPDTYIAGPSTAGTPGDEAWAAMQKNAARWTQTYSEMRQYNQAQKRARDRHSPEALAKAAEVPRLGRDELDPVTGKLRWPEALMTDDFAKSRDEIERLFELRAWTTQRADASARIRELAHSMADILREKIDDMTPEDFVNARKFLDGIEVAAVSARS